MDATPNFAIPIPKEGNSVADEFYRLMVAMGVVDEVLKAILDNANGRAPLVHTQAMSTIIGLVEALAGKMPAGRVFKLDDLIDVEGADGAPAGYIVVKNGAGMWVPSSASAALGPHGHLMSEITGLGPALAARPERSEVEAALDEFGDAATKNVGTTANTVAAGDDPRFAQSIAPVGSVLMVYGNGTTPAPGYLLMNGFSVTNTYPDLRAFGLANGWAVDGNGDPICPNMGGKFPRGWLPGQVIDSGRVFGTSQADAFQNITGSFRLRASVSTENDAGAFQEAPSSPNANAVTISGSSATTVGVSFDASRVARTAAETRPHNETFTFWIKAYGAHTDTSDIDLNGVVNDTTALKNRATALETKVGGGTIGVGQTWQVASRIVGTIYQNTTGRAIAVSYYGTSACVLQVSTDNATWVDLASTAFTATNAIIPPAHYYRFNGGTLSFVRELR
ncbi:MAG: hypothetical protein J0H80_05945 [Rhizobiales bacterium]|nr:hypothetical protein [Hyphomicrobiales bacterium]